MHGKLFGKEPDIDIEIKLTGLRPGEKLYEELITEGEDIVETEHEKIMVLKPSDKWNGRGTQAAYKEGLYAKLDELYEAASRHDASAIKAKMKEIVPEYQSQDTSCVL